MGPAPWKVQTPLSFSLINGIVIHTYPYSYSRTPSQWGIFHIPNHLRWSSLSPSLCLSLLGSSSRFLKSPRNRLYHTFHLTLIYWVNTTMFTPLSLSLFDRKNRLLLLNSNLNFSALAYTFYKVEKRAPKKTRCVIKRFSMNIVENIFFSSSETINHIFYFMII